MFDGPIMCRDEFTSPHDSTFKRFFVIVAVEAEGERAARVVRLN
jgi:hypothetical protein